MAAPDVHVEHGVFLHLGYGTYMTDRIHRMEISNAHNDPGVQVCLSLGANLGEPARAIDDALRLIGTTPGLRLCEVSSYWLTKPVGFIDQPDFINAASVIRCWISPRELLERIHEIERTLGRSRRARWHEREIDIDILLFGDNTIQEPGLTIPHAEMHRRAFVLQPLAEIAPMAVHPTLGLTVHEMATGLANGSMVRRSEDTSSVVAVTAEHDRTIEHQTPDPF